MVFCACGSLMEFGHILRERVLDTMTNLHQQWLAPHRKQSGDKQGWAYKPPCGMWATLLYRGMHLRWKIIIVRILTGLRFSFGFSLNISMNSISQISTIWIQLITQYQHHAQRFLANGMVYRHGANVCWTALDGSCLGWASGTRSRKNCWDKLHQWLEVWELTPQGVFYSVFVNTDWYATCWMRYYLRTSMNWGSTSTEAAKTSGMMTTIWQLRLCATLTKRPSIVSMAPPCIFTLCPLVMLISSGRI